VDSVHCPSCGAVVRPKESWCSLCYQDLNPAKPLVSASQSGSPNAATNLNESQTPGDRATNIAGIPRPASPPAQESHAPSIDHEPLGVDLSKDSVDLDQETAPGDEADESRKAWPCSCGTDVAFDVDMCPVCGRTFLGDLRGVDAPHRRGPAWLRAYLDASRSVRLAIAGSLAFLVAFAIPGFLALFG
jgi:hypothetical protein